MEHINHTEMVKALAKDGADIILGFTPESAHFLHMAIGLCSEVGELVDNHVENGGRENKIVKLGDIEFYFEGIVTPLGISEDIEKMASEKSLVVKSTIDRELLHLVRHSGNLLDSIKKNAVYVKDLDVAAVTHHLLMVRQSLRCLYCVFCIKRKQAIEANIAKLGERYSNGTYSDEQAQERNDKEKE